MDKKILEYLAHQVRKDIINITQTANSGHIGGSCSGVELLTALYFDDVLRYDITEPKHPNRDRVLIRGHVGPLRYSIFSILGWINKEELNTYRRLGSRLQGHESMFDCPGVDITPSGSLGMTLSYGAGAALVARRNDQDFRTYVFIGDGEEQEGSVSEAARHIAHLGLENIICVMDKNHKQLSSPTKECDSADIATVWRGYGWKVIEVENGNDLGQVSNAYRRAIGMKGPAFIIANTIKGFGLPAAEKDPTGYHTINVCDVNLEDTVSKINDMQNVLGVTESDVQRELAKIRLSPAPAIKIPEKIELDIGVQHKPRSTSYEYLDQFIDQLGEMSLPYNIYILTPDYLSRSFVQSILPLKKAGVFVHTGIREQHALAMAHGISVTDPDARVFLLYGDPFVYRGSDQINVLAQGKSNVILCCVQAGLSSARNGPTHQSTGQPGAMLTLPGIMTLEPADHIDFANCMNLAFNHRDEPVYIRSHRISVDPLPRSPADSKNCNYYIVGENPPKPSVIAVASGFPVDNAVKASKLLENDIPVRVINVVNMKSLDNKFVYLLENDIPILTFYNGAPFVLQSAVATAAMKYPVKRPALVHGFGFDIGTSGTESEVISHFGLDTNSIADKLRQYVTI